MRKKGIAVFCSLAVLFSILFGGFPQKWQVSAAADMTNFAEEAAALTNQFRQENGLPALQMAPVLLDLSAQRAEELSQTYGHNRPGGNGSASLRIPRWIPIVMRRKMWRQDTTHRRKRCRRGSILPLTGKPCWGNHISISALGCTTCRKIPIITICTGICS